MSNTFVRICLYEYVHVWVTINPPTHQPNPTTPKHTTQNPNLQACRSSPQAVLGALEQLLPPLEAVANKQIKETSVRACVRVGGCVCVQVGTP